VGMGAFYAATARATLTAIVMIAELTNDFHSVLPVMFAAVSADAVSIALHKDSIYTVSLTRQGIRYEHDRVQSPLDVMQVKDVMSRRVQTVPAETKCFDAFVRMLDGGHTGYPVVDREGKLAGIITRRDLSRIMQEDKGDLSVGEVVTGMTITAFPDELLARVRDRMHAQDIGRLVVVDPEDRRSILGIITRSDILHAESRGLAEASEAEGAGPV
ncbi:MAG TPA: CBS domain-containing protein, partial [Candidatus Thermoplasmatota archaeon]|nr:CBS domain-containing protein [Candidatus Thermoplasmatota archaeon]